MGEFVVGLKTEPLCSFLLGIALRRVSLRHQSRHKDTLATFSLRLYNLRHDNHTASMGKQPGRALAEGIIDGAAAGGGG